MTSITSLPSSTTTVAVAIPQDQQMSPSEAFESKKDSRVSSTSSSSARISQAATKRFPEHVRKWPHPGKTSTLRKREQFEEFAINGDRICRAALSNGLSLDQAQRFAYDETYGTAWSTGDSSDYPFATDGVYFEEACDHVEQNCLTKPLFRYLPSDFFEMLQSIHQKMIDPQDTNLKGIPPGQFRRHITIAGLPGAAELLVFKFSEYTTFSEWSKHKLSQCKDQETRDILHQKLEKYKNEVVKKAEQGFSYHDMFQKKLLPPDAIAFLSEYIITYPDNKKVIPLMLEMFLKLQDNLHAQQSAKIEKMCKEARSSLELFPSKSLKERVQEMQSAAFIQTTDNIAAQAHLDFVAVHPFSDGNGRMARTLMNILYMQEGLEPLGFPKNRPYKTALQAEDSGQKGAFAKFLREHREAMTPIPLYVFEPRPLDSRYSRVVRPSESYSRLEALSELSKK